MSKGTSKASRWMGPLTAVMWIVSLLYVLLPTDLVPDILPVIGWLDDLVVTLGSLSATAATIYATLPKRRREQEQELASDAEGGTGSE